MQKYFVRQLNSSCRFQFSTATHKDLNKFRALVDEEKPILHCMYFRASWNPQIEQSDKVFDELVAQSDNTGFKFYKFDTDADPRAKHFYNIKAEPEFVICCLGAEMTRQIGLNSQNKELLQKKLEKVAEFHRSTKFIKGTDVYEKFETEFMRDYEQFSKEEDFWFR